MSQCEYQYDFEAEANGGLPFGEAAKLRLKLLRVMWGEIEPPVKTLHSLQIQNDRELTEEDVKPTQRCDKNQAGPKDSLQTLADFPVSLPVYFPVRDNCLCYWFSWPWFCSQTESRCVNAMIVAVAVSGSPVKSQQVGDAELTLQERREELLLQYQSRPLVFLERYHVGPQFIPP